MAMRRSQVQPNLIKSLVKTVTITLKPEMATTKLTAIKGTTISMRAKAKI
jgi:hypothetical protein